MAFVPRRVDTAAEVRLLRDLGHRVWLDDPGLLNFEASFGMLAWERGGAGDGSLRAPPCAGSIRPTPTVSSSRSGPCRLIEAPGSEPGCSAPGCDESGTRDCAAR